MLNQKEKNLAAVLKEEHSSYQAMKTEWELFVDMYEGGKAVRKHLVRYDREHEDIFKIRRNRAFYLNFVRQIVDTYSFFIFGKPPVRSEETVSPGKPPKVDPEFKKFLDDVDRKGTSIDKFMKEQVLTRMALFGHVFVLVDSPVLPVQKIEDGQKKLGESASSEHGAAPVMTEQQRIDFNLSPFYHVISPLAMRNWAVDEDGKFIWVRWVEKSPPVLDPFKTTTANKMTRLVYKTYTRTGWFRHVVEGDKIIEETQGNHGLNNQVPIVKFQLQDSLKTPNCGLSAVADSAYINLAIFQWTSLLDEDLFQKVMNVLVMSKVSGAESEAVIISEHNVLEFSGPSAPFYLSPASSPGQTLLETVSVGREFLFKLAHLGGTSNPTGNQSGVSHAFDFNETNQFLKEISHSLSNGENVLFEMRHNLEQSQQTPWKGSVSYAEDYGIELPEDLIRINSEAANFVKSPTFSLLMQQKVAAQFIRKEEDSLKVSVLEEINESITNQAAEEEQLRRNPQQGQPPAIQKKEAVGQPPVKGQ